MKTKLVQFSFYKRNLFSELDGNTAKETDIMNGPNGQSDLITSVRVLKNSPLSAE